MKSWYSLVLVGGALCLLLGAGSSPSTVMRAHGGLFDTSNQLRRPMVSVFGMAPWYYGFGVGAAARYTLPLLSEGFLPTLNDSFELELGADAWYGGYLTYSYVGLMVPVEGRWTFHFTDKLAAYWKLGLGWTFVFSNVAGAYGGGLYWNAGPGVIYQLSEAIALRAEVGYAGLRAGVGFRF